MIRIFNNGDVEVDGVVRTDTCTRVRGGKVDPLHKNRLRYEKIRNASSTPKEIISPAFFAGNKYNHFGHFLLESLSRLSNIDGQKTIIWTGDPGGFLPFQEEILQIIGLGDKEHVFVDNIVTGNEIAVTERNYVIWDRFTSKHAKFLARIKKNVNSRYFQKKVWLSRGQFESFSNEWCVESVLSQLGWLIVRPESLSVKEQAEVFSSAAKVAGIEGSAFHVLLLCSDLCCDITLFSRRNMGFNGNYKRIDETLQSKQKFVNTKLDPFGNIDIEVLLEQLDIQCDRAVEYILRPLVSVATIYSKFHPSTRHTSVNAVRDLAINAESADIELAYELMSLADKYRPGAKFIENKIDAYRDQLIVKANNIFHPKDLLTLTRDQAIRLLYNIISRGIFTIRHPKKDILTYCRQSVRVKNANRLNNVLLFSDQNQDNHWYLIQAIDCFNGYVVGDEDVCNVPFMTDTIRVLKAGRIKFDLKSKNTKIDGLLFSQTRPFHFFFDMYVNYFALSERFDIDEYCFTDNNCFVKKTPKGQFNIAADDGVYLYPLTVNGSYKDKYSEKMNEFLLQGSKLSANLLGEKVFWFGITGFGRSWLEQVEGYVNIATELLKVYEKITVCIDGFTNFVDGGGFSADDQAVADEIVEALKGRSEIQLVNLVNRNYEEKIAYCKAVDVFVANSGSGSIVPLTIVGTPGVLHSNGRLVAFDKCYTDKTRIIPNKDIAAENRKVAHHGSYSIHWRVIFEQICELLAIECEHIPVLPPKIRDIEFQNLALRYNVEIADLLRDFALVYEKSADFHQALCLMEDANSLRPGKKLVSEKLDEYKHAIHDKS